MDGQRKDATHSTIWLMLRPLLMNYAKLCPRERSHMFIMKAAGVLEIPWVSPNELHVTRRRDTQHGATKGGDKKKKTQPSLDLIGYIHQAASSELWQEDGFLLFRLWSAVLSEQRVSGKSCSFVGRAAMERSCTDGCHPRHRVTPGPELKHGNHFAAKCLQLQPVCVSRPPPPFGIFICVLAIMRPAYQHLSVPAKPPPVP